MPVEALDAQLAAATDPVQQSFTALMRCYADGDPIEMGATARMLPGRMTTVGDYAMSDPAGRRHGLTLPPDALRRS